MRYRLRNVGCLQKDENKRNGETAATIQRTAATALESILIVDGRKKRKSINEASKTIAQQQSNSKSVPQTNMCLKDSVLDHAFCHELSPPAILSKEKKRLSTIAMAPTEQQAKQNKLLQLAGKKTPKARIARYLKTTEPQVIEPTKNVLLLQGLKASATMMTLLRELKAVQAPHSKLLNKKNAISVFDDGQSLEFLLTKNDCALFGVATHNKKRPNNLIIGRTFDHQILDMAELGVTYYKSLNDYGGTIPKKRGGSKPLLLFVGDLWRQEPDYENLQNLLTDFYRGDVVEKIVAQGLDHLITFTAARDPNLSHHPVRVHQRTYFLQLKRGSGGGSSSSGVVVDSSNSMTSTPQPYLQPCGPDFDFCVRRTQWADGDLAKAARKQPARSKKRKNLSSNLFGETLGRLHLQKQSIESTGRKSKALRRAEKAEKQAEKESTEAELDKEKDETDHEVKVSLGME
jgi:ribosome production factor 2